MPTLYGASKLKIPAGSQTGKVFRLKDKGIPHLHGMGRGDQMVSVARDDAGIVDQRAAPTF